MRLPSLALGFLLGAVVFIGASLVIAWSGPAQPPPNGNVDAPINVGPTSQVKEGVLGVDALAVFGAAYIQDSLGIANSAPSYPLDVSGDIHNTGNTYSAAYFHNSDEGLKENIRIVGGLSIVSRLRGVSFTWKQDGTASAGVIPHEVESVLPSAVRTDARGFKVVEYDQIIAVLIEAVKEQQAQIEKLKAEH
jgi:hypothetical protein